MPCAHAKANGECGGRELWALMRTPAIIRSCRCAGHGTREQRRQRGDRRKLCAHPLLTHGRGWEARVEARVGWGFAAGSASSMVRLYSSFVRICSCLTHQVGEVGECREDQL